MIYPPKTRKEASEYRYGQYAGRPNGTPYTAMRCAFEVWMPTGYVGHQCYKLPGYGPEGMYCKVHARIVEEIA